MGIGFQFPYPSHTHRKTPWDRIPTEFPQTPSTNEPRNHPYLYPTLRVFVRCMLLQFFYPTLHRLMLCAVFFCCLS